MRETSVITKIRELGRGGVRHELLVRVIADVTCCGEVPRGKALLRSGARAGDRIYVTGQLGGSANGLARGHGPNLRRHLRPQPRIQLGLVLQRLRCSACMDVSDGLALDLHRLLLES